MVLSTFGKNLSRLRRLAGLTQKQLAEKLEIPVNTLAGYENAGRDPKISTLIKVSDYFNVSVDDLIKKNAENDVQLNMEQGVLTVSIPNEYKSLVLKNPNAFMELLNKLGKDSKNADI